MEKREDLFYFRNLGPFTFRKCMLFPKLTSLQWQDFAAACNIQENKDLQGEPALCGLK